jgi:hypothetical protein
MNLKAIGALVVAAVAVAAYTSARADDFAYEATGQGPLFGVVNLTTGVFTPSGTLGLQPLFDQSNNGRGRPHWSDGPRVMGHRGGEYRQDPVRCI